ncbi:hypothetical protein BO99DRAFT_427983 [Aspergillus violaceofuscus CBS 115571]|uniref:Uncharacterized protein n=1 Tax=Aspergillus violaceofuscus (strain CBS 115571) TaxID=1450538 RepID=A0A2V5I739_ASPV1|nr:hypothetical protein BO99DRAFT_427983 [Aspergillus violaceofuscus CBS 115571]
MSGLQVLFAYRNDHTSKLKAKAKANEAFKHQNTPDVRTKDPPEAETKELTPSETKGTSTTKDTSKATDTTQSEPRQHLQPRASDPSPPSEEYWQSMYIHRGMKIDPY